CPRVPSHRDRHVAEICQGTNRGIRAHHDGAGSHGAVEPDDPASAQGLDTLDGAPFAYRIDVEGALLQLRFLPALGKALHAPGSAFRIVLVVFDGEAFVGEEALLDGDAPRPVVRIAVALQAYGASHRLLLVPFRRARLSLVVLVAASRRRKHPKV